MAFEADQVLDRIRLKAQLAKWRLVAIVAVVSLIGAIVLDGGKSSDITTKYIARVEINEIILEDHHRIKVLERLRKDEKVKAVLVAVNSPGGTIVGGETLYRALKSLAEKKPVVAVMGSLATSGGYMAALGANYIVAHQGTVTGSIGVLLQTAEITELSKKMGIEFITLKSGELKGSPSPFEPLNVKAKGVLQETIDDSLDMFVDMVVESRPLDREQVLALADGRVFTGRQALKESLVDMLGGEREAVEWLQKEHAVAVNTPVRTVDTEENIPAMQKFSRWFEGYTSLLPSVRTGGLWAIWGL